MRIEVSIPSQELIVFSAAGDELAVYPVSTASNGPGQLDGSMCTPCGLHEISECIGAGEPLGTVFKGREPTGEIYDPGRETDQDLVLTRILWLYGLEPGVNQGGEVDTKSRFIYIHGTPHEDLLGMPASHGCVRMGNIDVLELFDMVDSGVQVLIRDED